LQRCPRQGAFEELALRLRIGCLGAVDPVDLGTSEDDEKSVAQPGGGHLTFELAFLLRPFVEIAPDQLRNTGQSLRRVRPLGLEKERLAGWSLQGQHAGDALGVGPFAVLAYAQA